MKNFNEEILTKEEKEHIEKQIEDFSKDDRDFIRAFWVEPLSIKDDIWKIAFLNSQENYYAVITTDKKKEPLQEIINFLEEFIDTKEKISVNINNFVLSIEIVDKKVLFEIYNEKNLIYNTYTTCDILIAYLYVHLMFFVREKYDFDIPYFNKDILTIYSNKLGYYNNGGCDDFYAWDYGNSRWKHEKDNIRKAKWCLISANAKRVLINNRFCYEYKGKLIKESEMSEYIYDIDKVLELEKTTFTGFMYGHIYYGKSDYYENKIGWNAMVWIKEKICDVELKYDIQLGTEFGDFETEAELRACIIAQFHFCKLGLDNALD